MMKRVILAALIFTGFTAFAFAQSESEPPYGMGELEAYSIFIDAYRTDDYELAMDYGEWMIEATPRTISGHDGFNLETQFVRMVNIYVGAAEQEGDPSRITELLEKAENVFERAYDTFSEDEIDHFDWYLRQGRFYHENHENMDADMSDAVAYYEKVYEMDKERFADLDDGFYARVLLTQYATNGERDKALEMIDEIEQYASFDLQDTIDQVRESLFENPEERIEFIESRIAEADDAEREEMLEDLVNLYNETGQSERAADTAYELYELNPNFNNTRSVADIYLSDGNYEYGIEFLKEAHEKAEDEQDVRELTLEIAETYQQLNNLQSARDYTRDAINMDSDWGAAYMRMASIYAAAVSECTGGDTLDREDRTVYWLVLDYLDRAAAADPSLASTAQNRAESYEEAMPSSEDKFFSDWEDGQSFEIDGNLSECYAWINETTTVR
jgi:tetratricopeptide (TPR) repeat protein